ncbi:polysaccharide deacetylase family protein [Fodinicola feengrottensis]|uniref:polysaccharide deacetylase family protein n=1 Tax=Fodinicola feengrottensis TaxID=435914 RepID=UPI0031E1E363
MRSTSTIFRLFGAFGVAVLLGLTMGCDAGSPTPNAVTVPVPSTTPSAEPTPSASGSALPTVNGHLKPDNHIYETNGTQSVALSFDDGPDPTWTPQILAVLREYHVHAVFCEIGFRVKQHPELTKMVAKDGNTLCNHTMWHKPELGKKPAPQIVKDLADTNWLIQRASGGVRPVYFRAPQGDFTDREVQVAAGLGLASLGWKVTSSDWQKPLMTPKNMLNWVDRTMQPGCIILFHDGGSPGTHAHTVAGLKLILDDIINKKHWTVVTL